MKNTLDKIYENIAQSLIKNINEEWKEVTINVEKHIESIRIDGYYISIDNLHKEPELMNIFLEILDDLQELNTIMAINPKHKWNKAKIILNKEMDFNIKFKWDQELEDELIELDKKE